MLDETYAVDRILARRPIGPKTAAFEYLTAWLGYGTSGDTWEHESFFDEMLTDGATLTRALPQ